MAEHVAAFAVYDEAHEPTAVLFAVPYSAVAVPRTTLTVVGPDHDAIELADRLDVLVDLGIGRSAAFWVRTGGPTLLGLFCQHQGTDWQPAFEAIGPLVVAASPTSVVTTVLGRAELHNVIPPPGGRSPDGPHTYLLPARLALGVDEDGVLPAGCTLGATARLGGVEREAKARVMAALG